MLVSSEVLFLFISPFFLDIPWTRLGVHLTFGLFKLIEEGVQVESIPTHL